MPEVSTKPYLLRAIYEWCTDNGYTPHIAVVVDARTRVPMQFVKNGEIVLNISFEATSGLKMDDNVIAIYARENGQGMAFEAPAVLAVGEQADDQPEAAPTQPLGLASVPASEKVESGSEENHDNEPEPPKKGGRPVLTRIK